MPKALITGVGLLGLVSVSDVVSPWILPAPGCCPR
jgi:hypothetical protein